MKPISISEAQKLTSPNPFALITSVDAGGKPNAMALSWWTYLSNRPATIGICLSQRGYSGGLIAASGEFGLSIVGEALADAAFQCGCASGRDTDKVAKLGLPLEPATEIKTPLIAGSRVAMECKVIESRPVQDHQLFIAEVVAIHGDPEVAALYAMGGYGKLATV